MRMLHSEVDQMRKVLGREGINTLYHFTDVGNFPLIRKCKGLWSKEKLEKAGLLSQVATGGNELSLRLDKRWSNWGKVHLYFSSGTPTAYNKQKETHLCYLLIDPEVPLWQGVVFTDMNATDNMQHRAEGLAGLGLIDFSAVKAKFPFGAEDRFKKKQAEALIPNEIPLDYLKGVAFISEASLQEAERLWGNGTHPPFRIDKTLFHSGFPYVDIAVLTPAEVAKDNVGVTNFEQRWHFVIPTDPAVTLLVNIYATLGVKAKVQWKTQAGNAISEDETDFESQGKYWHWERIATKTLQPGSYFVEYLLGDIRWLRIPFSVSHV